MWERMFDLVLGLKKEHRLMMVITLIYAVTLFGITVDVEAMENWLQLVGYTIRTLCIIGFQGERGKALLGFFETTIGTSGHPSSRFGSIKGFYHAFRRNRFSGFGPS